MTMQSSKIEQRAAQLLSLEGKVAVVTGAASGIGRGISLRLAEMGAFVAILDIDEDKVAATAAEIEKQGSESIFLKCDVRSATDCQRSRESRHRKEPARSISSVTALALPSAKTLSNSRKTNGTALST